MVEVTIDGKKVGFKKIKGLAKKAREAGGRVIAKAKKAREAGGRVIAKAKEAREAGGRVIAKAKEARKPEAQLAKIKAKQEILTAKAKVRQQRIGLAKQRAELRGQQLKAAGINVPKFVRGTRELGMFASGNGLGFKPVDMGNVLSGGQAAPIASVPKQFRTVTRKVRIKSGKRKGKFRTTKGRVAIKQEAPKPFDPFSQFQGGI